MFSVLIGLGMGVLTSWVFGLIIGAGFLVINLVLDSRLSVKFYAWLRSLDKMVRTMILTIVATVLTVILTTLFDNWLLGFLVTGLVVVTILVEVHRPRDDHITSARS